ncbi:MAG: UDP-N-acetylglucosamine 4,6-dehydratase (inverting) [bacterium]|nr:UDP-N-acetylglucosamine 4,6-dehydratase (inverting) [bacterium]
MFDNKTVIITGGTGSFGKNYAKFLLDHFKLKKLIIFSRDEFKQFKMAHEMTDPKLQFCIGDVKDINRLRIAFREVDIIIHAAALKQIPILESNPFEAVKTNIIGSQNVIEAALDSKASHVLLISSDKAVQPINLYGATKLCAEKEFVAANIHSPRKTKFSIVRYGNVMGSRGSIIETLLKEEVKNVKITHSDMTRFWITLEQSFDLVNFALKNMEGGEIFIPKIPSMKLVDLFDVLAPGAKKQFTGIRPGEKMHEMLLTSDEARRAIELDDYFVIFPDIHFADGFYRKHKGDKKIEPGFYFSSDTNKAWLTKAEFKKKINEITLV